MLFMYGIKLPRKRKKAFLAYFAKKNQNSELTNEEYALQCYCSQGLVCEILWGEKNSAKTGVFMTTILKIIGLMFARSFNNK
jgi:hypothetical protein